MRNLRLFLKEALMKAFFLPQPTNKADKKKLLTTKKIYKMKFIELTQ